MGAYWMNNANTVRYPGHTLVNLHAATALHAAGTPAAAVRNLTDRHYAHSASSSFSGVGSYNPDTQNQYSPGRARTLMVGLSYAFDTGALMDGTAQAGLAAGAEGRPRRAFAARLNTFLFRHHRWFGVVSCVALMAWGASGVLHPLIGRLGPQAATMAPPPARLELHALPEPGELIRRAGIRQAAGCGWWALTDGGQPRQAWQVTLPGAAGQRYLDAADALRWTTAMRAMPSPWRAITAASSTAR